MYLKSTDADRFVSSFGTGGRTLVAHGGWVGSGELLLQPFEVLSPRFYRDLGSQHAAVAL